MKPGEKTTCPACGQEIFVQEKNLMDDWKVVGKILVCPMCEAHLSRQNNSSIDADPEEEITTEKSALEDLLGSDEREDPVSLEDSDDDKHFCRDCEYMIVHPFMNRCTLHNCDVNPMGDCDDFIQRDKKQKKDEEE